MNMSDFTDERISDSELVRLARQGDNAAFATFFQAHKNQIYSLCLGRTHNPQQAEYCTRQAFLQIFRKLAIRCGEVALSTWLYKVAAATVLLELRATKKVERPQEAPAVTVSVPGTVVTNVLCPYDCDTAPQQSI